MGVPGVLRAYDELMKSERWLLLQLDERDMPGLTGYHEIGFEVVEGAAVGLELPLRQGGRVRVLWVDPIHHHLGVDRIFSAYRSGSHL